MPFHVHVDAIVRRGDEILIMKRAMGLMSGAWYFPGGALEPNESPEEGVRREIREETELEVENLRLLHAWHYGDGDSVTAVGITFVCEVPSDTEPRINEEHSAARWVTPAYYRGRFLRDDLLATIADQPLAYSVASGVRQVVDKYLAEIA